MRASPRIAIPALALLALLGAVMVFDQRFVSVAVLMREPASALYLYGPTMIFATLGVIQYVGGRVWPAFAFAIGLILTGFSIQYVIRISDGNPGYMFPAGHIVAPMVSFVAYAVSFLSIWGVRKLSGHRGPPESEE